MGYNYVVGAGDDIDETPPIDPLTGETAVTLADRVFALEQELLEASSRIDRLQIFSGRIILALRKFGDAKS